jgi:hypothetical protein
MVVDMVAKEESRTLNRAPLRAMMERIEGISVALRSTVLGRSRW